MEPLLLAGIGNVLTGDDAVGPTVIKLLEAGWEYPPEVTLLDAGTPGMDLIFFLENKACALVVDAVKAKGNPGEIRCFDKAALLQKRTPLVMSPHEPGLQSALQQLEFFGTSPREVVFIGVIPEKVETGVGLSAPVKAAIPAVLEQVLAELAARGLAARKKDAPGKPDLWWEPEQAG